ncbi:MAG: tRNA uridine-5-carboxymethylaminomethyl(34) synthesis GTPase MnmE [Micavibrio aeruginosavorus]|uniref:tRNA modification GTPase MnmE n=1 Tax=Micavibrio aeruginosavorus TaxID=349221 RepID=A0A2W5HV28_9BACT|nr:MAG: tRNA uridine-5-carboxymethylaminomethyl(34) synthesis GTPase MnmE [Micavibrio aeruginosavorus]
MSVIDTIYALSTPPGKSAVAVIRVSGPFAHLSLMKLAPQQRLPKPRQSCVRSIFDQQGNKIDEALVLLFAAPNSFTGENIVEYQVHGGWSVVQSLLQQLSQQENHRMALPGEFTRRAFENGKLDLTEAEAIADLIDAETQLQRLQALGQLSGSLERIYERWKIRLSHVLALMEADLDFSDQDLPEDILLQVQPDISDLAEEIASHLDDNRRGERLRNGFQLVILGAPNAGKSSLLNALSQRDVAIVSSMAGTTRDILETHLDIGGYPVILADTAGLRSDSVPQDEQGQIEQQGIERARSRAREADIKILLFDAASGRDHETYNLKDDNSIVVYNKTDLAQAPDDGIAISALSGQGIDKLLQAVVHKIEAVMGGRSAPALTRARHRESLTKANEALLRCAMAGLPELAAEDLRLAIRHLGTITGRVDVEDLLDMIFRDFCIGK